MKCLWASLAIFFSSASAFAEEEWFEAAPLAMGGAVRVLGVSGSPVRLNPAAMPGNNAYIASANWRWYERERSHVLAITGYDSKTSDFALGSSYSIHIHEPPFDPSLDMRWFPTGQGEGEQRIRDKRTTHRWDIAVAYGFLQHRFSIGATARIIKQDNAIRADYSKFTLDAGAVVWATEVLGFAVVGQNLIPTKDSRFPIRLAAGAALKLAPVFKIEADLVWDFSSSNKVLTDLRAGAEVAIEGVFAIRGGYMSDRKFTDHWVTFGVGLLAPQVHINVGMAVEAGVIEKRLRPDIAEGLQRPMLSAGIDLLF